MSRILRFFVCLGTLFFAGNALAAGYSCSSLPTYLSCQHGYYMTANKSSTTHNGTPKVGNYCQPCSKMGSNYTCAGGTAAPVESAGGYTCPTYMKYTSCSTGYYMTDSSTSTTYNGSPKVRNACRPCSVYGANYTCAGGTAAPQAITVNVTCQAGQYLPKGATSCTTCPAGSYCPGNEKFTGISLVTGATSDKGRYYCEEDTMEWYNGNVLGDDSLVGDGMYSNSAEGSSSINQCYLVLQTGAAVYGHGEGLVACRAGDYCDQSGIKIYFDDTEDRGLTDSMPTVGGAEACARGSISGSTGWDICRPCPNGTTSPGTGTSSPSGCNITCSNSANVATWVTPEWTPNYVSNSCKIASCVACTKGTGVASCSASIENNTCTYTATCASGYKNPTCNGSSCSCEVGSYTITLNATANGGTGGMSAVYEVPSVGWYSNAALTTSISSVTMPAKANSVFNGYYSAQSGGTRYITNAGALPSNTTFSANTTLYAQYSTASCNVTHGSATMSISGNKVSCAVTCNTGYSQSGGTNATTSFTVTGAVGTASVSASCSPRTFTVSLMDYDGTSTHGTIYEKYATGWYSNSAATTTLSKATVPTRVVDGVTYLFRGFYTEKQSDISANGGSGTRRITADGTLPANTTFTANTSLYAAWAKDCTVPENGSCTATIGDDGSVSYITSCNTGYTLSGANTANPKCTPKIYTITLNATAGGGTGGTSTIYLKYATGWYSDAAATNAITSITMPTKTNSICEGYFFDETFGSDRFIGRAGNIIASNTAFTANTTWYAHYEDASCNITNGSGTVDYIRDNAVTCYVTCNTGYSRYGGTDTITSFSKGGSAGYGWVIGQCFARTSTVSFDANGGTGGQSANVTAKYDSAMPSISTTAPTRPGYAFMGWYDNATYTSGTQYYTAAGASARTWDKVADATLYAGWKVNSYTCSAGQYLKAGATSCSSCEAGRACAGGTYSYNASSAQGRVDCMGRTQFSAAGAAKCSTVSTGYYTTGCTNDKLCTGQSQCTSGTWCASGVQNQCSSLTGVSVSGGTYTSAAGSSANTACKYTAPSKTITGCKTVTTNTVTYSGTAWPATTYGVTANGGYIISGNNTATATCNQCSGAVWSAGGTATSCSACPAQTSGWTRNSGTGWTAVTQCNQTKSVGGNCSAGVLKQNATSTTAWGSSTISTPLQAKPGSIVNGQKCDQCSGAVWSAGGTATSCSACPAQTSGWTRNSGTGWTAVTQCNQTKSVGGNCSAGVLKQNATSATAWGTTTISTPLQAKPGHIVSGQTCTGCVAGTYSAGGTATSCSACTGRTKYSAANASECSTVSTGYYTTGCNSNNNNCTGQSQCTSGTWCASGVQNQCSSLTGVSVSGGTYTSAAGSSANTACKYTAPNKTITGCKTVTTNTVTYSGTAWPATTYGVTANGGYIISGNNTAAATCSQCGTAKYSAGGTATSCSSCPNADSGWTATSPAGSTAYTACYEYQTPANCASGSVKRAASSATAYSSTISLLSTLKSKAGYYASTTATSCTICPAGSSCAASATAPTTCANWTYAASTGMSSCTACPALTSGWTKADSTGTGWKSHTNCVQISPKPANCAGGNLKQVAASNGATTWGASTVNSALSSNPGYYINGTACSACTGAKYYGGGTATSCTPCPSIYTSDTTAAKSKAEQCAVQTTAGKYIAAAKDTEQTKCPAKNYCPSESVKYGETNSPTACPTADATTARTTYPDDYLNPTRLSINNQGWSTGLPAITSCSANYSFTNAAGHFIVESVGYNSTTGKYENGGSKYYTSVNAGWYLVDKYSDTYCNTSTNPMYYHNVAECTANSYCPGYKSMPLCSTGTHNDEMGRFACRDLGNGYNYSPAKSGAETACYLTTSNSKFVAAAGAAESACTAGGWCPGGVRVNYGSTGGRNTCPTKYPSSSASSNSELDCYVTTAAGKYVATVGAGQVNCAGTGYYCPGGTNVYSGAYGSRLTTGGRTQCPAGYRDLVATASTTKEAQCTMNVAGGKYVKVAKESAASGTCAAGYAKAAHSVTYGNTSSCAACTGTTYAENTGQASCTACPTQSGVTNISYWISTGTHTDAKGCYGFYNDVALNNGSVARIQCFWDKTKSQYDTSCGAMKDGLKCNAAYYNAILESSPTNNAAYYTDKASVIAKACTSVGKGYWSPADVYTRTQCPAGYRDGTAGVSEAQCTMNVAGGKYVAKANESVASGTCVAGYAKAAHSVTYGNTSSCAACTGATYAASTGQASCTACPTAKTYASAVKSYGYWNNGKDGDHTISDGCYATMTGTLSNGSLTEHGCYLGTDGDYGNGGGKRCYVHQDNLKCNAGYYASTLSNGYVWNNTRAGLLGNTCVGVGAGYYSAANILTRNQCPTGLTTIGYGAGADEVTDCGRILHFGNDKLYLRSGKKTTPSLNVKIGDTTYYGNMTAGTGKGKLRLKSGTTTYSVHDDSM